MRVCTWSHDLLPRRAHIHIHPHFLFFLASWLFAAITALHDGRVFYFVARDHFAIFEYILAVETLVYILYVDEADVCAFGSWLACENIDQEWSIPC